MAMAPGGAWAESHDTAIMFYETWVQAIMLDTVKANHECEVGLTSECHETMTKLGVEERWLDQAKLALKAEPMTEAEAKPYRPNPREALPAPPQCGWRAIR
jgi:hypothetical protein